MLKLYGGARSRASIVQWYLEELGVPYEFVMLDMQAGEHRQPEFLTINPIGKVPAIEMEISNFGNQAQFCSTSMRSMVKNQLLWSRERSLLNGFCLPMLPWGLEFLLKPIAIAKCLS